jgi:hypothetical protein
MPPDHFSIKIFKYAAGISKKGKTFKSPENYTIPAKFLIFK